MTAEERNDTTDQTSGNLNELIYVLLREHYIGKTLGYPIDGVKETMKNAGIKYCEARRYDIPEKAMDEIINEIIVKVRSKE